MTAAAFDRQLLERFGSARVGRLVPLAPMTTFKVGGPADWLIDLHDAAELRDVLAIADAHDIHVACWVAARTSSFPMLESEAWSCGYEAVTWRGLPMIGSVRTRV